MTIRQAARWRDIHNIKDPRIGRIDCVRSMLYIPCSQGSNKQSRTIVNEVFGQLTMQSKQQGKQ